MTCVLHLFFITILYGRSTLTSTPPLYTGGCNAILTDELYDKCTNRPGEISTYATGAMGYNKNRILNLTDGKGTSGSCKKSSHAVCHKLFKLVRIYAHSFGAKMLVHFSDALYHCCGNCSQYYMTRATLDISNVDKSLLNSSDIILPVIMPSVKSKEMAGYHFIPVIEIPSAYYFTLKQTKQQVSINLILAYLKMWPLLIITLLIAIISGFLTWLIERGHNGDEFPGDFHVGIWDGFWWSFISVTTVGYGDKAPRTCIGRVFGSLCIVIGIVIISILVSTLTKDIKEVRSPAEIPMRGKLIGAMRNRLHDSIMIAQHGGILHDIDFSSTIDGVVDLMKLLKKGEIEGFLISRTTYYYFSRIMNEQTETSVYASHKKDISDIDMLRTEKYFRSDKLVVGMMVRNLSDYEFFRRFIEYNWLRLQACYKYNLNYKEVRFEKHFYSPYEGLLLPFLYGFIVIMGLIVCYGILYEGHTRRDRMSEFIRNWTTIKRPSSEVGPISTDSRLRTRVNVGIGDVYYLPDRYS